MEATNNILAHYGMPRRSGRYPWGSGEDPYQHGSSNFISRIELLKKEGWTETPENIKKVFGVSTTEYRTMYANAIAEERKYRIATAESLAAEGKGPTEIGRIMGINESSVRSLLNSKSKENTDKAKNIAEFLKKQVDEKRIIDVGSGVETELKISKEKLKQAIDILKDEGYVSYGGRIDQVTNANNKTTIKVLCSPGTEHKDIYNVENIKSITDYESNDGGLTFKKFQYPASMDSSRLLVRYAEDGGTNKDGTIEIRRGVKDLSLGDSRYAQVRILVDGDKYIKGMAVYGDDKDFPEGVDVIVNSNKPKEGGLDKALKSTKKNLAKDPTNPFGSLIKANGQSTYIDDDGTEKLSLINKRSEEGDWAEWKDKLPSQFLSKQSTTLAQKQLDLALTEKRSELDSILQLNNPTIKRQLLDDFAKQMDSDCVTLQAAALPGQKYHVILPINSLRDDEVYAPNYETGTKLALVRYPHGGTFEIPILTVNNNNKEAQKYIPKDSIDAVGINHNVASQLSGADFDGDTVMCIPTHDSKGKVRIQNQKQLDGLKGFEPTEKYAIPEGNPNNVKIMKNTQNEMGRISNLITDMTLSGASADELAAAVRHSMVVIDAEKHMLDYKQSEIDNNIDALKRKYQQKTEPGKEGKYGGAATLISRAKSEVSVDKRQGSGYVNVKGDPRYDPTRPEGAYIYKTADDLEYTYTRTRRDGSTEIVKRHRTQPSTAMAETDDAYTLVSKNRNPMELIYAKYANNVKDLANQARLEMVNTGKIAYSKEAAKKYEKEVKSLNDQLDVALLNSPKERQAQILASIEVKIRKESNPGMSKEDVAKVSQQALQRARNSVGAKRTPITISDSEYEAIQAGAISDTKLKSILKYTDKDSLREKATPRSAKETPTDAQIANMKAMASSNFTLSEIAKKYGFSTSTISKYLKG